MNKKLILTVTVWLVSLLMATSLVYVLATGTISNPTFEAGTQIETASYVVWREGSTYYSKNGSTGEISSSSNASQLIQNCVDALSQGNIFLRGSITLTSQIVFANNIGLVGNRYGTEISIATDIYAFNITNVQNVLIRDMVINVTAASYSSACIYVGGNSRDITLEDLYIQGYTDYSGVGVLLESEDNGIYRLTANKITTYYFAYAFLLNATGTTGWINSNGFSHIYCWYPRVGIQFFTTASGQDITYNVFNHIEMQANSNFQSGININETSGDCHYNRFYGVTIFDVPAGHYSVYVDDPFNDFFGVDAYSMINGSQLYGSTFFSSGWFKIRYINPEPVPATEGWGLVDRGLMWYCGQHNAMEFWNGTHIIYWNATGVGSR